MVTTEVDVYVMLDQFDADDLIAELKVRKLNREDANELQRIALAAGADLVEDEVSRATYELTAGRFGEALIWLERALPRAWSGRLAR